MQNIQDILTQLDRVNSSFSYDVWIPSLQKNVPFKEMTTAQQKRIIKSVIDSPVYNSEFIKACYNLIKENCDDRSIDIDKLTIIDKYFILLKMRSISIGSTIPLKVNSKKTNISIETELNLEELYEESKSKVLHLESKTFEMDKYIIKCDIPNILCEYRLENELHQKANDENIKDKEQLRTSVGEKFVSELSKYIVELKIEDNTFDLMSMSFKNRIQIIEKLPTRLIKNAFDYIQQIMDEVNKIIIIKKTFTIDGETEEIDYNLSLDSVFFINS